MSLLSSIARVTPSPKGEYPLPGFYFQVEWKIDKDTIVNGSFTEISGLNQETQMLEYRDGFAAEYATQKIAGMRKDANVTLKRGVFHGNNEFYDWWRNVSNLKDAEKYKVTVTINLLGEDQKPRVSWTLNRAWPVKIESPAMKADSNEVAIETIELTHEGLTIKHVSA
jgi:phage tail-like protein